jgi:hypothetical protein
MARWRDLYRRWKATATCLVALVLLGLVCDLGLFATGRGWWAAAGQLIVLPFLLWWSLTLDRSHMAELCGSTHPDEPTVLCDRRKPCFGKHSNIAHRLVWDGNPPPTSHRRPTSEIVDIALRAREEKP